MSKKEEGKYFKDFICIEATTTSAALQKLSKLNLKSKKFVNKKLIHINVKIDDKLEENLNETCFAHLLDKAKKVLVTFKSEEETKIFWRISGCEKLYLLQFDGTESSFCEQTIISEIIKGRNAILESCQGRKNLNLRDIGTKNKRNLLILAAADSRDDVVAELLKHDFNIDYEADGRNAIEYAWKNYVSTSNLEIKAKCDKIILSLLKNNSKFPRRINLRNKNELKIRSFEFCYEKASNSIKKFADSCEKLHRLVNVNKLEELKSELENEPNLSHFYNINNKSLIAHAIESNKIEIWKPLVPYKLCVGHHEIEGLGEFYKNYESSMKELIREEHQVCAKEIPSAHINFLLACTKIGNNDRQSDDRWVHVEEAYRIIDSIESCSKVLKVAAKWKDLTIFFDFKHDTAYYLDPMMSFGTKGVIYGAHTIYIGAKNLLDEKIKHGVYGVIIHELCHLAVLLTYINDFNPYPMGKSVEKTRYEEEVLPECAENGHLEDIVGGVMHYPEDEQNSEFIVRVVQILMHYYVQDPKVVHREKFGKLFTYFKEVVERDFDDFLKIIETLLDESKEIKYEQLTGPMKARILHSNVNFQGQETTLHDIIGNDAEILNFMTRAQIRDMLIRDKVNIIGEKHANSAKISAVERGFSDLKGYTFKDMNEIQSEVEGSKIFVLSDAAGAGKTTTFEKLSEQFREKYKHSWVCFIKLRDYRSLFLYYDKWKEINLENVLKLFFEIQNLDQNFESEIFHYLFKEGRVIFLLDGVDEISPDCNKFMIKILKNLKEETENQIWVSSRPQYATILEDILNVKAYKFDAYFFEKREELIKEIYENLDLDSQFEKAKDETVKELNMFFESLQKEYSIGEVNNPLMIKMITKLYVEGKIDLDLISVNLYDIFDKITDNIRNEIGKKIEGEDNNSFKDFNLGLVHQVLSLKCLFRYTKIKNLSVFKKWKNERKKWTVDKIQRFGYVTLDPRFDKNPKRKYIDFIHRTYAEFFVAQFIISIIFDCVDMKYETSVEFNIILKLMVTKMDSYDSLISSFILSYMRCNRNRRLQGNNLNWVLDQLNVCITTKSESVEINEDLKRKNDADKCHLIKFLCIVLSNNRKETELLWKPTKVRNSLILILVRTRANFRYVSEILKITNWYDQINKNEINVNINELENKHGFESEDTLKLISFVENNLSIRERICIYKSRSSNIETRPLMSDKNVEKNLLKFSEISSIEEETDYVEIMEFFMRNLTHEIKKLIYLKEKSENLLINCEEKSKNLLLKIYDILFHRIFEVVVDLEYGISEKLQILENTFMKSEKYKNELRSNFKEKLIRFKFFLEFSDEDFEILGRILLKIFKSNKSELVHTIVMTFDYFSFSKLIVNVEKFERFTKFLVDIDDSKLSKKIMREVLSNGYHSLILSLDQGLDSFQRVADLYLKDVEMYEEHQYYILNHVPQMLLHMSEDIYPKFKEFLNYFISSKKIPNSFKFELFAICQPNLIKNKAKMAIFEIFLDEYCNVLKTEIKKCMKQSLFPLILNLTLFVRQNEVENVLENVELIAKYNSHAEIRELFKTKNTIFNEIVFHSTESSYEKLIELVRTIFDSNKAVLVDCLKCYNETAREIFVSQEKVQKLEKFLDDVFSEDERAFKECVKRNMIHDNFHYIIFSSVEQEQSFLTMLECIVANNCSFNIMKNVLLQNKLVLLLFMRASKVNLEILKIFLSVIYKSDEESLINSFERFNNNLDFLNKEENFCHFREFILDICVREGKNRLQEYINKHFRYVYQTPPYYDDVDYQCTCQESYEDSDYYECVNERYEKFVCKDHELLLSIFYYEDLEKIKILQELNKKYEISWEWAQVLFLDKFPFEYVEEMSNEVYAAFEDFLKLVFETNINKLRDQILTKYMNDEILNNENENCEKFVRTFMAIN